MSRIVFLLEEPSMKVLLEGLLPRLLPGVRFLCVPHEGKSDLEKSIPRKLRAWREPGVRFVVVRDNDGGVCERVKARLHDLCRQAGRPDAVIRLPCQELEAWYLGEPEALARAYRKPKLAQLAGRAKYRDPDGIPWPSAELEKLLPEFQKTSAARRMGTELSRDGNRSHSFHVFLEGVERVSRQGGG